MLDSTESPRKWSKRLLFSAIIGALIAVSFISGVVITAVVAIALMLPVGLAGLASASVNATVNSLYAGDSETRLTALNHLQKSCEDASPNSIDPQMAAWILPAIEQCQTDPDPAVVDAATELALYITINTTPKTKEIAEP